MGIQTFWLEPTDQVAVSLRRYVREHQGGWTCAEGWHQAMTWIGNVPASFREEEGRRYVESVPSAPRDLPDWPTTCESCDYRFVEEDHWQTFQSLIYRRTDTDELRLLHQSHVVPDIPSAEPGASWDAHWMPSAWRVDGTYLMVRLPDDHDWAVDSRASNCGSPDDQEHQCWVRHGDPRECRVTVDKGGNTCSAGAGSIGSPGWHGFLRDGQLVE